MSDYKETNIVVQANELVQNANWAMNIVPLKLFKGLVSCIDVKSPPKDNHIEIEKKDLYRIVGIDKNKNNYTYLRKQMESLMKQIVYLNKGDRIIQIPLISKVIWEANSDEIKCYFDPDIMPYLIQLHGLFLQYPVKNLVGFTSKYGLLIYENLLSRERQYKSGTYTISIKELRYITGTEKRYSAMPDFEKRVLAAAAADINKANVEFLVRYSTVKSGRSIKAVKFDIRPRTSCLEDNYNVVVHPRFLEDALINLQIPSKAQRERKKETMKEEEYQSLLETYNEKTVA